MRLLKTLLLSIALLPTASALATPITNTSWEVTGGYGNGNKPSLDRSDGILEWRVGVGYYPAYLQYKSIYLGAELAQAYLNGSRQPGFDKLRVTSLSPVLRWYFLPSTLLTPFIEGSAGPGYLSATQFDNRNLGMHFTFQDYIGMGTLINTSYPIVVGFRFLHYSNAGFSNDNPGITMPGLIYAGVRF